MRLSSLVLTLLPLTYVFSTPLLLKRQDGNDTIVAEEPTDLVDSTTPLDSTTPPVSTPTSPESRESPSPVDQPTPSSPTGLDGETFPTPVPSPPTESTPATPKSDDCPPCEDKPLPVTTTSSGEVCYCLGGGQPGMNNGNREPWTLAGPSCNEIDNENPTTSPEEGSKPIACSEPAPQVAPGSSDCKNACNFVVTAVNSAGPCSRNVIEAARQCANCGSSSTFFRLPGISERIRLGSEEAVKQLEDGLAPYCARPGKCYDIRAGKTISGQNGCPVSAANSNQDTRNSDIVFTATRSFTDIAGKPTFALELMTVDDPAFVPNTVFAGARPTDTSSTDVSPTGGVRAAAIASLSTLLVILAVNGWVLVA